MTGEGGPGGRGMFHSPPSQSSFETPPLMYQWLLETFSMNYEWSSPSSHQQEVWPPTVSACTVYTGFAVRDTAEWKGLEELILNGWISLSKTQFIVHTDKKKLAQMYQHIEHLPWCSAVSSNSAMTRSNHGPDKVSGPFGTDCNAKSSPSWPPPCDTIWSFTDPHYPPKDRIIFDANLTICNWYSLLFSVK